MCACLSERMESEREREREREKAVGGGRGGARQTQADRQREIACWLLNAPLGCSVSHRQLYVQPNSDRSNLQYHLFTVYITRINHS